MEQLDETVFFQNAYQVLDAAIKDGDEALRRHQEAGHGAEWSDARIEAQRHDFCVYMANVMTRLALFHMQQALQGAHFDEILTAAYGYLHSKDMFDETEQNLRILAARFAIRRSPPLYSILQIARKQLES